MSSVLSNYKAKNISIAAKFNLLQLELQTFPGFDFNSFDLLEEVLVNDNVTSKPNKYFRLEKIYLCQQNKQN